MTEITAKSASMNMNLNIDLLLKHPLRKVEVYSTALFKIMYIDSFHLNSLDIDFFHRKAGATGNYECSKQRHRKWESTAQ